MSNTPYVGRSYRKNYDGRLLWCNTHGRKADWIFRREDGHEVFECDPRKGGIMMPCSVVDLTGLCEIVETK